MNIDCIRSDESNCSNLDQGVVPWRSPILGPILHRASQNLESGKPIAA